jgi:hypothetical protein
MLRSTSSSLLKRIFATRWCSSTTKASSTAVIRPVVRLCPSNSYYSATTRYSATAKHKPDYNDADDIIEKNYSDEFDESDAIEVGKEAHEKLPSLEDHASSSDITLLVITFLKGLWSSLNKAHFAMNEICPNEYKDGRGGTYGGALKGATTLNDEVGIKSVFAALLFDDF